MMSKIFLIKSALVALLVAGIVMAAAGTLVLFLTVERQDSAVGT